jgi:DNA primase
MERILLRALVLPEDDSSRRLAAARLSEHPEWYDGLTAASVLEALAHAPAPSNPLDAAPDQPSRALLALALQHGDDAADSQQPLTEQVQNALDKLELRYMQRRQREIRTLIAEAYRRGDEEMLKKLSAEKVEVDGWLRNH